MSNLSRASRKHDAKADAILDRAKRSEHTPIIVGAVILAVAVLAFAFGTLF